MKEIILGVILLIQGIIDIRHREIPFSVSAIGAIVGIGICIWEERELIGLLLAVLPGIFALLFAKISHESLGYGDGVLFVVMGIYLSWETVLAVGMFAFSIAGVCALVLIVIFRKKGNYQIPFVPFLTIAYILRFILGLEVV